MMILDDAMNEGILLHFVGGLEYQAWLHQIGKCDTPGEPCLSTASQWHMREEHHY